MFSFLLDQSPLLLCKMDDSGINGVNSNVNTHFAVTGAPQCIDTKQLQVFKGIVIPSLSDIVY